MRELYEERNGYNIRLYEIDVDDVMKRQALDFAVTIITGENQYIRLSPIEVRTKEDLAMKIRIEIQRTYMGKIGELVFSRLLSEKGICHDTTGMFEIYEGQTNVDSFDFETRAGRTVDVKTGFRSNHKRLLVNVEQFDRIPKDYYVGVLLNAKDTDVQKKLVEWESVTKARIMGYAEHDFMMRSAGIGDFGEGLARNLPYNRLLGVDRLLREFKIG